MPFAFRNHRSIADILESAGVRAKFVIGAVLPAANNVEMMDSEQREIGILTLLPRKGAGHSAEFTPVVVIPVEEIHRAATDRR